MLDWIHKYSRNRSLTLHWIIRCIQLTTVIPTCVHGMCSGVYVHNLPHATTCIAKKWDDIWKPPPSSYEPCYSFSWSFRFTRAWSRYSLRLIGLCPPGPTSREDKSALLLVGLELVTLDQSLTTRPPCTLPPPRLFSVGHYCQLTC